MDSSKRNHTQFRATQLWNFIIDLFRNGMPTKRHRKYVKIYENCFVASQAVGWLHNELLKSGNFTNIPISRSQTILLLEKLRRAGVFRELRAGSTDCFSDDHRLYRFTSSEEKYLFEGKCDISVAPREVNISCNHGNLSNNVCVRKMEDNSHVPKRQPLKANNSQAYVRSAQRLTAKQNQDAEKSVQKRWSKRQAPQPQWTWQIEFVTWMRDAACTNIIDTGTTFPVNEMKLGHLAHNVNNINKYGVVTKLNKEELLPSWILSAMRCLVYWPMKIEENLPEYEGFENDVFKVIHEYFNAAPLPLLDSFSKGTLEIFKIVSGGNMSDSTESLMMNLTMQADIMIETSFGIDGQAPVSRTVSTSDLMSNRMFNQSGNDFVATIPSAAPPYRPPPSYSARLRRSASACPISRKDSLSHESYMAAINAKSVTVPPKQLYQVESSAVANLPKMTDLFRLVLLLLPPANRRKLHLLMRLLKKITENDPLLKKIEVQTRDNVLDQFADAIFGYVEKNEKCCRRQLISYLVDNYSSLMHVDSLLKIQVNNLIEQSENPSATTPPSIPYCVRIKHDQLQKESSEASTQALTDLFAKIVTDPEMIARHKKNHIRQFQHSYPHIYAQQYILYKNEIDTLFKPTLLARPLQKLMSLRM